MEKNIGIKKHAGKFRKRNFFLDIFVNDCPKTSHWDLEEKKGKLADSQSMTNQKWKLIIGHMGTPTNRDRARDELWFYERRRTSEDTVHTLFCKLENPP